LARGKGSQVIAGISNYRVISEITGSVAAGGIMRKSSAVSHSAAFCYWHGHLAFLRRKNNVVFNFLKPLSNIHFSNISTPGRQYRFAEFEGIKKNLGFFKILY
jgi:hypothetical protein